jgi:DNA-nicking Smr family endonuclease
MVKDLDLFRAAMADVVPLKGRRRARRSPVRPKTKPLSTEPPSTASPRGSSPSSRRAARAASSPDDDFSFDRDVDRALSRGRRSPEATLDLHGMTLAAAERAVARFLEEAVALDLRVVLIVTGKGLRQEGGRVLGGLIRAEFPGWLRRPENWGRVRGMKSAHPRHGGPGAFYILLRRRRPRRPIAG